MLWKLQKSRRFNNATTLRLRVEALEERQLLTAVGWNAPTTEQVPYGPEYCATFASRYERAINLTNIQNDVAPILTTASNEWTVNSLKAEGEGTLRWAIDQANDNGGGTIKFADDLNGAIYLGATGELEIKRSLTIDASNLSDGITISAANDASEVYGTHRVFNINGSSADTTKVEMIGVTITGGCYVPSDWDGGGGICVTNANLTLTNSRVENNCVECDYYPAGGGIYADNS